ncbi:DUF262 domain-containing protein [Terrisporobacter glycolicus]|nr:DUF262 domain-containing protein [Terrisporobacter glycolicus]
MTIAEKQKEFSDELISNRKKVIVDQMRMSVGELMSLYECDEINLSPDYQRLFRWSDSQRSDFIESILLGYPIPPIFVYQDSDGKWDVVDGVQRLSTIYEFTGILNNDDTTKKDSVKLQSGRVLKHLEGFSWDGDLPLDPSTKLYFRRSALNIITILDKNEDNPTYEIFRRLNTGGSRLSDQEIRNVLILMCDKNGFNLLSNYCNNSDVYSDLLSLSSNKDVLGFKMEVISRYIVIKYFDEYDINSILKENKSKIDRFLDKSIEKILKSKIDINECISNFNKFIEFLSKNVDYDFNFRIYDNNKDKFTKGFNWLVFETLVWGLATDNDIDKIYSMDPTTIANSIKSIVQTKDFCAKHGVTNMKSTERMMKARDYAKEIFSYLYE